MNEHEPLTNTRVRVGRSPRVHLIRGSTIHTRRGYGTTYCGYYGRVQDGGWLQSTTDDVTCKQCLKRAAAS